MLVTMVESVTVGVDVGEGEARDGDVFGDPDFASVSASASTAAATASFRPVPWTLRPEGFFNVAVIDLALVPVSRRAWYQPTIPKGSAVVSSNGRPSVR